MARRSTAPTNAITMRNSGVIKLRRDLTGLLDPPGSLNFLGIFLVEPLQVLSAKHLVGNTDQMPDRKITLEICLGKDFPIPEPALSKNIAEYARIVWICSLPAVTRVPSFKPPCPSAQSLLIQQWHRQQPT